METRAGDPGAFAQFDLHRVDSPAFVVDLAKLRSNLQILADVRDAAEIKVLAALKAFSMWSVAPVIGEYLDGVCTRAVEARLAAEHYDGEIATYCAAYKPEDLEEICRLSDHVIFNSPMQIERCSAILEAARLRGDDFDIGLRVNPLHAEGEVPRYDPCAPHSRLGFPVDQLTEEHIGTGRRHPYRIRCASRTSNRSSAPGTGCSTISSRISAISNGSISAAGITSPAPIISARSWSSSCRT